MNALLLSSHSSGVPLCRDHWLTYKVTRKGNFNHLWSSKLKSSWASTPHQHFLIHTTHFVRVFSHSSACLWMCEIWDQDTVPKQMLTCKREGQSFLTQPDLMKAMTTGSSRVISHFTLKSKYDIDTCLTDRGFWQTPTQICRLISLVVCQYALLYLLLSPFCLNTWC